MTYPQETKEFQPIIVKVDGVEVLEDVEVAVIPTNTRPTTWVAADKLDTGHLAVRVENLAPGIWNVWARVTTVDEVVVVFCGNFKVTD